MIKLQTKSIRTKIRLLLSSFLSLTLVLSLIPAKPAYAESNQLFVTPDTSQMNKGTTFCIDVKSYSDTDRSEGTAAGSLTYPSGKLQVVSGGIKKNGETCSGTTSSHYGSPSITQQSGKVIFDASRNPAPSGIAQIIGVKFKAIGAGTAVISFSNDSKVNATTTTYRSGVYTITDPAPPPDNPSPSPSPPSSPPPQPAPTVSKPDSTNSNSSSNGNGSSGNKDTDPSTITTPDPTGLVDNVIIDVSYTTATITWDVNGKNSKATLKYGTDTVNFDKNAKITKKSGKFSAQIDDLEPGERYYFTIVGEGGGKDGEYSGTIYAQGFPILIQVTENNVPVSSAQVSIGGINRITDSNGKLALALAAGDYSGIITTDTATLNISMTIKQKDIPNDDTSPEIQSFPYNLTSSPLEQGPGTGFSLLAFIGILIAGTVVLGFGFVGFISYRRRRFETIDTISQSNTSTSSVVIDDGYNWQQQAPNTTTNVTTLQTQQPSPKPTHNNSVYIDDEEPLDMFDQAKKTNEVTTNEQTTDENNGSSMTISH